MKKLFLLGFLFYTAKTLAIDFNELKGCFRTVQINGSSVNHGPLEYYNQSKFEVFDSETYKDIETSKFLDLNVMTLFTGYTEPYYGLSPFVIFPKNYEQLITEKNYLYYKFDRDVYMQSNYMYKKVDHYLELEMHNESIDGRTYLEGVATMRSIIRKIDRVMSFRLEKTNCADEI